MAPWYKNDQKQEFRSRDHFKEPLNWKAIFRVQRRIMSMPHEDEVTFHDASSYFSEDEWTHLYKWQKELYSIVMKEIHRALISLGPIIINTVFSLRAKDKQERCSVNIQDCARRQRMDVFPTGARTTNPGDMLRIHKEEILHLNNARHVEGSGCLGTEESVPILIDHLGEEVGENGSDPNLGHDVISFCIKAEEDTNIMDHENKKGGRHIIRPTGDRGMKRQNKDFEFVQYTRPPALQTATTGPKSKKLPQIFDKGLNYKNKPWSENEQDTKSEEIAGYRTEFSNSEHVASPWEQLQAEIPNAYNECESNMSSLADQNNLPDTHQNEAPYECAECGTSYSLKEELVRHMGSHSRAKPYLCTECGKSFFRKAKLIMHQRIHTGIKPYECLFCHKTFSRKDNLNGHMRIHTGEKPYGCTQCEKRFTWKCDLNTHQKRHQI
ncbi:hypothetical protein NDU88_004430 [Pleurodeles waltl]|uniref:Uncharacterized protein n=1 Tax=Pleurodeles waltl TaxID=8319 RepID=A0AAV7PFM6_PLEWA|nr:hypothetical protein NDU88_004430 [Pleurodeles waltl]